MSWFFPKMSRSSQQVEAEAARNNQKWAASSDEEIAAHVRALVVDEYALTAEKVYDGLPFNEFIASMEYVELFMRCEEEFGIGIPDEEPLEIETVGDLSAYIIGRLRVR